MLARTPMGFRRGNDGACMGGDNGQVVTDEYDTAVDYLSSSTSSCSDMITACQPDILMPHCGPIAACSPDQVSLFNILYCCFSHRRTSQFFRG